MNIKFEQNRKNSSISWLMFVGLVIVSTVNSSEPKASSSGIHLEQTSLVSGVNCFNAVHKQKVIGELTIETSIEGDIATIKEITKVLPFGVDETLIASINRFNLQPKSYQGRGISGKRTDMQVDLVYSSSKVTGTSDQQKTAYNIDITNELVDKLSLFYALHALPLKEGYQVELQLFDALRMEKEDKKVIVTGIEKVTVAAGTFEAFRVLLEGGQINQIFYVSTESPRKIVKIAFETMPDFSFDLIK